VPGRRFLPHRQTAHVVDFTPRRSRSATIRGRSLVRRAGRDLRRKSSGTPGPEREVGRGSTVLVGAQPSCCPEGGPGSVGFRQAERAFGNITQHQLLADRSHQRQD
jgi:hypothetical protein